MGLRKRIQSRHRRGQAAPKPKPRANSRPTSAPRGKPQTNLPRGQRPSAGRAVKLPARSPSRPTGSRAKGPARRPKPSMGSASRAKGPARRYGTGGVTAPRKKAGRGR
jgi:hypothetical protein